MRIALDFDGTITERPEFFARLSAGFRTAGHEVVILTVRHPAVVPLLVEQLAGWGVEFDRFQCAHSHEDKGGWCEALGIDVLFEDSDECIGPVRQQTLVLKVRNERNFDFDTRAWRGVTGNTSALPAP